MIMPAFLSVIPSRFLAGILVSISLLGGAWGQELVRVKLLCLPKQAGGRSIELLVGEGKVVEVPLQSHEFTLPLEVPRMAAWKFGKSGVDEEGNFTFATQVEVKPLAVGRQLLVFIRKGAANADGFKVVPLDMAKIRGKDYMVMNLAREEVAGMVGGRKFKLAPRRHTVFTPKADRGENLCFASLLYQRKGEWRSFFSSNWRLREKSRALIFIYSTPGQRSPRVHSVIDPL